MPNPMNREHWLGQAVEALRPVLIFKQAPLVSVGWPSRAALATRNRRIGECWGGESTGDGREQVFITPTLVEPVDVLAVLLHELIHVKVGVKAGHRGPFKREMRHVGLEGKPTATRPGAQCAAVLAKVAAELGPYPHAAIVPGQGRKVQGTRMLKAQCPACDCVVRITRQWAGSEGETLPFCGFCAVLGDTGTYERMLLVEAKGD